MVLVQAIAQIRHWRDGGFGSHTTVRALRGRLPRFLPNLDSNQVKEIIASTIKRTTEIVEDERSWSIDIPTRAQLEWAASMLAAFQAIRPHVDTEDEAVDFLAQALLDSTNTLARRFFSRCLPKAIMKQRIRAGVAMNAFLPQYGTPWHWRGETRADGGVNVIAKRCFYHGFMTAHGEPGLTRVFCRLDTAWTDPLLKKQRGIGFKVDEHTSLANGDGQCCFPMVHLKVSAAATR
jgi:hypothetical protein